LGWGVKPRVGEGYQILCQTSVSALRVAPAEAGVNARPEKFNEKTVDCADAAPRFRGKLTRRMTMLQSGLPEQLLAVFGGSMMWAASFKRFGSTYVQLF
jgi:hypothetical protein